MKSPFKLALLTPKLSRTQAYFNCWKNGVQIIVVGNTSQPKREEFKEVVKIKSGRKSKSGEESIAEQSSKDSLQVGSEE